MSRAPKTLRVGTFNVENLVSRLRFDVMRKTAETGSAMSLFHFPRPEERELVERSLAVALEDDKRQMTALAIVEGAADIWCLQEVDSLGTLQAFFANYVHRAGDMRYGHFGLMEGNDQRGIDVGFAARRDMIAEGGVRLASHAALTYADLDLHDRELARLGLKPDDRIFVRDCLMVDLAWPHHRLTLFVCHFKSMSNGKDDGRVATLPIRRAEARAVAELIRRRFGAGWRDANWIVAGDLNGFRTGLGPGARLEDEGPSGIEPLTEGFGVDPLATLPPHERWTHFRRWWSEGEDRLRDQHMQLDYVLLSPALAAANPAPRIDIVRRGQPYRAPLDPRHPDRSIAYLSTRGDRYPRVGWDRPKASDHSPVIVEIELPAG